MPIPPLWMLLRDIEKSKGRALTQQEVVDVRDRAVCVMMTISSAEAYYDKTGFFDLDLPNFWEDWQSFRLELLKAAD